MPGSLPPGPSETDDAPPSRISHHSPQPSLPAGNPFAAAPGPAAPGQVNPAQEPPGSAGNPFSAAPQPGPPGRVDPGPEPSTPANNPFSAAPRPTPPGQFDWTLISDGFPFGLVLLGPRQEVLHENERVRDLLGFGVREKGGIVPWLSVLCPDAGHRERVLTSWQEQIWRNQLTRTFSLRGEDQRVREIEFHSSLHPDGGLTLVLQDVTDSIQAEEAYRQGKLRFRTLFNHSQDGIALLDPAGRVLDANKALLSRLGCTTRELKRTQFRDRIHSRSQAAWDSAEKAASAGAGDSSHVSITLQTPGGETDAIVTICPIREPDNKPSALLCIVEEGSDVGESQTQSIEALRAKLRAVAKKAQALLHSVPDLVVLVDPDLSIADFSPPPHPWPEHAPDDSWRGAPVSRIWPTLGRLLARSRSTILNERKVVHARLEGQPREALASASEYTVTAVDGGGGQILVSIRRLEPPQARGEATGRDSEALSRVSEGILFFDRTGALTDLNPAASRAMGIDRGGAAGRSLIETSGCSSIDEAIRIPFWEIPTPGGERRRIPVEVFEIAGVGYGAILDLSPGDLPRTSSPDRHRNPFAAESAEHRLRNLVQLVTSLHQFEPSTPEAEGLSLRWQTRMRSLIATTSGRSPTVLAELLETAAAEVGSLTGRGRESGRIHLSGPDHLGIDPEFLPTLSLFLGEVYRIVFSGSPRAAGPDLFFRFLRDRSGQLQLQFESAPGRRKLSEAEAWEGEILEVLARQMNGSLVGRPTRTGEEWTLSASILLD